MSLIHTLNTPSCFFVLIRKFSNLCLGHCCLILCPVLTVNTLLTKESFGTKCSRTDQVKFVKTAFKKIEADHTPSNFLKAVFRKFFLVHSWILCCIYCRSKNARDKNVKPFFTFACRLFNLWFSLREDESQLSIEIWNTYTLYHSLKIIIPKILNI